MKRNVFRCTFSMLIAALAVAACQNGADDTPDDTPGDATVANGSASAEKPVPGTSTDTQGSPGKPSAPISIDYTVNGTPIVGHPVNIDLKVSSTLRDRPVTLNYRVVDTTALTFPEAQVRRVSLGLMNEAQPAIQQVTVVPQREGRLYINVTAEIETEDGMLLKSMAIPIQVGSAPAEREENGELKQDADGEAVISMPADDQ